MEEERIEWTAGGCRVIKLFHCPLLRVKRVERVEESLHTPTAVEPPSAALLRSISRALGGKVRKQANP
jgi:hypothetical protein